MPPSRGDHDQEMNVAENRICPGVFEESRRRRLKPVSRNPFWAILLIMIALASSFGVFRSFFEKDRAVARLQREVTELKRQIGLLETQTHALRTAAPEPDKAVLELARSLKTSPADFVGRQVKLQARFSGFESRFLDAKGGPKFASTYYSGFTVQSGREREEPFFTYLFISKKEAMRQHVYDLQYNDQITIYGQVNSADKQEPWIEVYVVKKGWE
jgi:hypothetical protein